MLFACIVSAGAAKGCSAGENRLTFSSMLLRASSFHHHSCLVEQGTRNCVDTFESPKQVGDQGDMLILLICDLFSPALQFLAATALTLFARYALPWDKPRESCTVQLVFHQSAIAARPLSFAFLPLFIHTSHSHSNPVRSAVRSALLASEDKR